MAREIVFFEEVKLVLRLCPDLLQNIKAFLPATSPDTQSLITILEVVAPYLNVSAAAATLYKKNLDKYYRLINTHKEAATRAMQVYLLEHDLDLLGNIRGDELFPNRKAMLEAFFKEEHFQTESAYDVLILQALLGNADMVMVSQMAEILHVQTYRALRMRQKIREVDPSFFPVDQPDPRYPYTPWPNL